MCGRRRRSAARFAQPGSAKACPRELHRGIPATDGGFWLLGLREPGHAEALRAVPMSVPDTGARTAAALRGRGLRLAYAPPLRDVDTAADAWAVARAHPHLTFAAAVRDRRTVR